MSYAALCEEERRLRDGLRVTEQRQSKKIRNLEDRVKEREQHKENYLRLQKQLITKRFEQQNHAIDPQWSLLFVNFLVYLLIGAGALFVFPPALFGVIVGWIFFAWYRNRNRLRKHQQRASFLFMDVSGIARA